MGPGSRFAWPGRHRNLSRDPDAGRFDCGLLHAVRHLARDGALLLDRSRGRRHILADLLDRLLDGSQGSNHVAGNCVEIADFLFVPSILNSITACDLLIAADCANASRAAQLLFHAGIKPLLKNAGAGVA